MKDNNPKLEDSSVGQSSVQIGTSESQVLSVEQLNREIRQMIEGQLSLVWVRGELSNFKAHTSGHFYFSLKDSKSQIRAVMFRGHNSRLKFKPHDGLEVLLRGRVTVYEPRGEYQISVEMMEPVGAGALQKAYEQLKIKLKQEGLFEAGRKRPLPAMPRHVAIVTSPTGAAIRDMLNVLSRRNKSVKITVIPTLVQGEAAAPQICEALKKAYILPEVDAIIIGRGGGSMEDLWAFNDEKLARLIVTSPVPVISAVGHEIDFTISDFVADLRAPTPSAAAELVVKNAADLFQKVDSLKRLLVSAIQKLIKAEGHRLRGASGRLVDPKRKLQELILRNDELLTRLGQSTLRFFQRQKMSVNLAHEKLVTPEQVIEKKRSQVSLLLVKLQNEANGMLEEKKFIFREQTSLLDSLSPLKVVERGYSMTLKGTELIKDSKQLKSGDEISIRLMKGSIKAKVLSLENS